MPNDSLTKEEVSFLFEEFCRYLEAEQERKEALLRLRLRGNRPTDDSVAEQLALHDALIAEISQLRDARLLPIVDRLLRFVGSGARHDHGTH